MQFRRFWQGEARCDGSQGDDFFISSGLDFWFTPPAHNRFAMTLLVTGTVVFLMVYVVMPRYTKLIKRWLFN